VAAEGILKCYAKTEAPTASGAMIESPKASRKRGVVRGVPLLIWGSVLSSPSKVWGSVLAKNGFYTYLRSEVTIWSIGQGHIKL